MTTPEINHLIQRADQSRQAAKLLLDNGSVRFSAAWSCQAIIYLAEALLLSKGLSFSRHSTVVSAYGREFAKTGLVDSKFQRYVIEAQQRRATAFYNVGENVSDEDASESLEWAGEFLQAAKEYLA